MKNLWKYLSTLGLMLVSCLCLGVGLKASEISFGVGGETHGVLVDGSTECVYIASGKHEMKGGTIGGKAYGIYISGGTFTMSGGTISNCSSYGVYLSSGTFNYSSGTISDEIYLSSSKYITLTKAPTSTLKIRLSSTSSGTRVAYLSGISSLTSTQLSYLNVVNMPSGYRLEVSSGYVVLAQSVTNYTVTISAGSGGSVSTSSVSVPSGTTYTTSGSTLRFSNGTTVTATPNSGYTVGSWSPSNGTITSSTTIRVTFITAKTYSVTIKQLMPSLYGDLLTSSTYRNPTSIINLRVPEGAWIHGADENYIEFIDDHGYDEMINVNTGTYFAYISDQNGKSVDQYAGEIIENDMTIYVTPYGNTDSSQWPFSYLTLSIGVETNDESSYGEHKIYEGYNLLSIDDKVYLNLLINHGYILQYEGLSLTQREEIVEACRLFEKASYGEWFAERLGGTNDLIFCEPGAGISYLQSGMVDLLLRYNTPDADNTHQITDNLLGAHDWYTHYYDYFYVAFNNENFDNFDLDSYFSNGEFYSGLDQLINYWFPEMGIESKLDIITIETVVTHSQAVGEIVQALINDAFSIDSSIEIINGNMNDIQRFALDFVNKDMALIPAKYIDEFATASAVYGKQYNYYDLSSLIAGLYGYEGNDLSTIQEAYYQASGNYDDTLSSALFSPLFTRSAVIVGTDVSALGHGTPTMPGIEYYDYATIMKTIAEILRLRNETDFVSQGCSGDIYGYFDGLYWQDFNQYLQEQGYSFSADLQLDKEDILDTKKYYNSPIVDRKNIA